MISWFGVHVTEKGKNRDFAENQGDVSLAANNRIKGTTVKTP